MMMLLNMTHLRHHVEARVHTLYFFPGEKAILQDEAFSMNTTEMLVCSGGSRVRQNKLQTTTLIYTALLDFSKKFLWKAIINSVVNKVL